MTISRKETSRLLDMMDEGLVSAEQVVLMCVNYMSEADVADMMQCNELSEDDVALACLDYRVPFVED